MNMKIEYNECPILCDTSHLGIRFYNIWVKNGEEEREEELKREEEREGELNGEEEREKDS